jgi:metallophosphoesterase superfamily enzyme
VGGRCFIGDGRRLILPAFGAYAGGLDVRDPAIAGLFSRTARIHILGRMKLHSFAAGQIAAA